jgi:hypothetical protein
MTAQSRHPRTLRSSASTGTMSVLPRAGPKPPARMRGSFQTRDRSRTVSRISTAVADLERPRGPSSQISNCQSKKLLDKSRLSETILCMKTAGCGLSMVQVAYPRLPDGEADKNLSMI